MRGPLGVGAAAPTDTPLVNAPLAGVAGVELGVVPSLGGAAGVGLAVVPSRGGATKLDFGVVPSLAGAARVELGVVPSPGGAAKMYFGVVPSLAGAARADPRVVPSQGGAAKLDFAVVPSLAGAARAEPGVVPSLEGAAKLDFGAQGKSCEAGPSTSAKPAAPESCEGTSDSSLTQPRMVLSSAKTTEFCRELGGDAAGRLEVGEPNEERAWCDSTCKSSLLFKEKFTILL